jgi:hypothetical protein
LGDNINTVQKNTKALTDAYMEIGLEVKTPKTKYMSRHQNAGQNHNIKIANISFENVALFKYLGRRETNQNLIYEEIMWRLNSGNACHHFVQIILSTNLLSKKSKN